MPLIVIASAGGSPGVTTASLALAATWPGMAEQPPLLVEADCSGGTLAVRWSLPVSPGLVEVAAESRHTTDPAILDRYAYDLAVCEANVRVVVAPPGPAQVRAALTALTGTVRDAARGGRTIVVDLGRVEPGSAGWPLLQAADVVLLVVAGRADQLGRLAWSASTEHDDAVLAAWKQAAGERLRLLAGHGSVYPAGEVADVLGVPVADTLPDDPRSAAMLAGQARMGRRGQRTPLMSAAARLAATLHTSTIAGTPIEAVMAR